MSMVNAASAAMKRQTVNFVFALAVIGLPATCYPDVPATAVEYRFESIETTVLSRGVDIPVTFIRPIALQNESFPLVVMAHGHGGTRNEAGGYTSVAEGLAVRGVASIRMDFPGCGESSESFVKNNLGNMLKDIQASRDFAVAQEKVDQGRVGLLGFSMGGHLVLLLSSLDESYKVIATWAPSASSGSEFRVDFLGGQAAYTELKSRAASDGFAPFTTPWGQHQKLGLQWFTDLEQSRPLDAVARFEGPLLVLYGDRDDVVPPHISESVIAAATNSAEVVRYVVKGADHGLGLFTDEPNLTAEAISTTVSFFG